MKSICALFLYSLCIIVACSAYYVKPGPRTIATKGEIWPKPQYQDRLPGYLILRPSTFQFFATDNDCDILQEAFTRYHGLLLGAIKRNSRRNKTSSNGFKVWREDTNFKGYLNRLMVNLTNACQERPSHDMEESYILRVNSPNDAVGDAVLEASSIWGALRGLETFSQILIRHEVENRVLVVNSTIVNDAPRFSHRGILLDTSRHFIPVVDMLKLLDAMSYNKMNVFHWHIVDDESFPYESVVFPELSKEGAYHPSMVYSQTDIANIIEHARMRGIRVMAEFDTPGHVRSWGVSHPELLTTCYTNNTPNGYLGPMNPTRRSTYEFIQTLLSEVAGVFPEKYIHLGGDEVGFSCWKSNEEITEYMQNNSIKSYHALEEYYIQQIVDMVDNINSTSVVWQEVFENGVRLPNSTIIHIWTGKQADKLNEVTSKGHPALLSACWYLDYLAMGGDWSKYYDCDPHDFPGTVEQKQLVLGGEACMWAESVDTNNVLSRIWPRASAAAEKLWSASSVTDKDEASRRLEEHACRMNIRGIPAQPPNGPGFCVT